MEDKNKYTVHINALKLYLRLGLEITAIHRILKFTQEAWMKIYIDKNTELRQKATSTFQKNFFKLMNVSVFGKVGHVAAVCLKIVYVSFDFIDFTCQFYLYFRQWKMSENTGI